jgi:hypothetical protein
MRHDSRASLLAHNLVAPCLGHKPKARVVTLTQWIPMLALFKQLLCEYKFIVMNMYNDLPINLVVATNYEFIVM